MAGKAKEIAKLTNRANTRGYNQSMKEFAAQKADLEREVELTNLNQEAKFQYEQEIRNLQRLSALDGYQQNQQQYKQQLINNQQAADAAVDSQNSAYESRLGQIEDASEDQYIAYDKTQRNTRYNLEQTEFTLDQAIYGAESDIARAENSKKQNQLEYDDAIASLKIDRKNSDISLTQALNASKSSQAASRLNYKNQLISIGSEKSNIQRSEEQAAIRKLSLDNKERDAIADRNFETLSAQIEDVMNSGSARAAGRTGNSANNAVQSTIALFALNTAKIEDALYRSKANIDAERRDVASQMAALSRQTALLLNKEGTAFEGLQQALKDANDATNIAGRKYGVEQDAIGNRTVSAGRSKSISDESTRLSVQDANKKSEFAKRSASLSTTQLMEELKADTDVFKLNQQRLGESIVNAAAARSVAMTAIARGKVQADRQADAARMLPPRFAPDPPKPYKAEMPTLVPPPEPIPVTREAYQIPQPQKQSGLSKVLSIGAAVVGVAGAVFTAGASLGPALGATTGMFAAGGSAASIGSAAGALSTGLGTIGQFTY